MILAVMGAREDSGQIHAFYLNVLAKAYFQVYVCMNLPLRYGLLKLRQGASRDRI